jgi:hypothetical protein
MVYASVHHEPKGAPKMAVIHYLSVDRPDGRRKQKRQDYLLPLQAVPGFIEILA